MARGRQVGRQSTGRLASTPPGIKKAVLREVRGVLRSKRHVGYPPSVATDAQLGFSVMARQYAEVLFGRCYGNSYIPVRKDGTRSRARQGRKKADALAQRAKTGHCPCFTRPTHVAATSRYAVGGFPPQGARGVSLWMEYGPLAARHCAASIFAQFRGRVPPNWD